MSSLVMTQTGDRMGLPGTVSFYDARCIKSLQAYLIERSVLVRSFKLSNVEPGYDPGW